jgi:hypothetical protein
MSHQQHQTCCWWCSSSLVSEHLALFLQIGNFEEMMHDRKEKNSCWIYRLFFFFSCFSPFFKKRRGRLATSCVRWTDGLHFFTGLPLYGPIKFNRINHRSDASKAQRLPSETSDDSIEQSNSSSSNNRRRQRQLN